jgi:hypothetical protein
VIPQRTEEVRCLILSSTNRKRSIAATFNQKDSSRCIRPGKRQSQVGEINDHMNQSILKRENAPSAPTHNVYVVVKTEPFERPRTSL